MRLNLEFHVFAHNVDDVDGMRELAATLGMPLRIFKGVVPGEDWDTAGRFDYCVAPVPLPCIWLWGTALVSTDGGVLACRGGFQSADDMTTSHRTPATSAQRGTTSGFRSRAACSAVGRAPRTSGGSRATRVRRRPSTRVGDGTATAGGRGRRSSPACR